MSGLSRRPPPRGDEEPGAPVASGSNIGEPIGGGSVTAATIAGGTISFSGGRPFPDVEAVTVAGVTNPPPPPPPPAELSLDEWSELLESTDPNRSSDPIAERLDLVELARREAIIRLAIGSGDDTAGLVVLAAAEAAGGALPFADLVDVAEVAAVAARALTTDTSRVVDAVVAAVSFVAAEREDDDR